MEWLNFSTTLVLFWKWLVNGCEQALHVAQQHYAGCSNNNKQSVHYARRRRKKDVIDVL
jgi:hypothetical protein